MSLKIQYRPGDTFFHRMDPSIKFLWMILVVFLLFIMVDPFSILALFLLTVFMGKLGARLSVIEMAKAVGIIVPAALTVGLLNLFASENIFYGTAMSLRMITVILPGLIFSRTTDPRRLTFSLVQVLKIPYMFAFMVNMAYRFVPIFEDELKNIMNAHAVRGVDLECKGLKGRIRKLQLTVEPLLIGVIRKSQLASMAVQNRAFGAYKTRTYVYTTKATFSDKMFILLWVIGFFMYALTLGSPAQLLSLFLPWQR